MSESPDGVKVDTEDETSYFVVDPDDYQKTKKLEAIHKTKREVPELRKNKDSMIVEYNDRYRDYNSGVDTYNSALAQAVAQYGSELLPLIEEARDNGILDESDLTTRISPEYQKLDVINFIEMDGRVKNEGELERPHEVNTMAVYRQLERIQRKLGFGIDIEEDKGPAEI